MQQNISISIKKSWKEISNTTANRLKLIVGSGVLVIILTLLPHFFSWIEKRDGIVMNDWVLEQIKPHNVSVLIFIFIWGMSLLAVYRAVYKPSIYMQYCWSLIFISGLRVLAITLFPLNPPAGLIPLSDPLTGIFYGQAVVTKDLFFSGHTSIMTLNFLCLEKRSDKIIGIVSAIAVAILLMVQHIHYTIDIVAAPIVTYICFSFTKKYIV
jgi:hypothetical protein